MRRSLIKLKNV